MAPSSDRPASDRPSSDRPAAERAGSARLDRRELARRARESLQANRRLGIRAPDFGAGHRWLNVSRPLTLHGDLAGKVVLVDFWTYCCINCQHVLPALARLEARFAGRAFAVVGCHSAKFANEREVDNVRRAVLRHRIAHPVVVDDDFRIWQTFVVRAWPTLTLIGPDARVLAQISGEPDPETLEVLVEEALGLYHGEGILDDTPLPLAPETARELPRELAFPGKVAVDPAGARLYVADTGHHRILELTPDGDFLRAFGSGEPGLADGPGPRARFRDPQGMAFLDGALLVADTGNHALRRVDLATGEVATVAGTGEQGRVREGRHPALGTALNSPWDLLVRGPEVLIAMAGPHQLWSFDPAAGTVGPRVGDGSERHADGPFEHAAFAQPSGLAGLDGMVYVADSESSSVRAVDLDARTVRTVAGGNDDPRDLFHFGDEDGAGHGRRFQHPLGIAAGNGALFVADSYNHKVKRVDPATGAVSVLAGSGRAGAADGASMEASFHEPGGLAVQGGRLIVADTDNHRLRTVDPATGEVGTLRLTGVAVPPGAVAEGDDALLDAGPLPELPGTVRVTPGPVRLVPGEVAVRVELRLPERARAGRGRALPGPGVAGGGGHHRPRARPPAGREAALGAGAGGGAGPAQRAGGLLPLRRRRPVLGGRGALGAGGVDRSPRGADGGPPSRPRSAGPGMSRGDADPWGPLGRALLDAVNGDTRAAVVVHTDHEGEELLAVRHFLREPGDFPPLEVEALGLCRGRVLDAGAGSGDHARVLQARGFRVTALDVSPLAVAVQRKRGIRDARRGDVFTLEDETYDTVLMMMNGIGLVGDLAGLERFLAGVPRLLRPGGQVILDSTDLRRSTDAGERRAMAAREAEGRYGGEVRFRMEYQGRTGAPFPWLFVDPDTLAGRAEAHGWTAKVLRTEPEGEYLARLERPPTG